MTMMANLRIDESDEEWKAVPRSIQFHQGGTKDHPNKQDQVMILIHMGLDHVYIVAIEK
jgi:hypothetical protein